VIISADVFLTYRDGRQIGELAVIEEERAEAKKY